MDSSLYCAQAGFDWLMHASYIDDAGIEACLKHSSAICPTLTLLTNILDSSQGAVGASSKDVFKREVDAAAENLSRAYHAGVPLICGSESGWSLVPYGHWHAKELQNFVELLGLTPIQAIHAATGAAARMLLKWSHEIGQLKPGYLADLIVFEGDPTQDISLLQKPSRFDLVMKGGAIIDREVSMPTRNIWPYERHRVYLAGNYVYDEETGRGKVHA